MTARGSHNRNAGKTGAHAAVKQKTGRLPRGKHARGNTGPIGDSNASYRYASSPSQATPNAAAPQTARQQTPASARQAVSRTPEPAATARMQAPTNTRQMPTATRQMPAAAPAARTFNMPKQGAPRQGGTGAYGRQNYGSGSVQGKRSRARTIAKRAGIGIAALLALLLVAGAAYCLWFTNALDRALAPDRDQLEAIDSQLVKTSLDEPFYVLVLGSDSREGYVTESMSAAYQNGSERSDVILLIRVDANARQLTLVSVPRDTPYTKSDGSVVKINEAYNEGGAAESIAAVSELTGVGISHYVEVHISEMEAIVDSLGGIDVEVDRELHVTDTITKEKIILEPGLQTLNGQQAQAFLRARHAYSDTEGEDWSRQSNVRTFVEAVIKKTLDRPLTELPGTVLDLAQYVTTDFTSSDLIWLASKLGGGSVTTYSCTGPSDGDIMEQYDGLWMCYPNPEGWAELMRQVDSGQEPEDIDYAATAIVE